MIIIVRPILMKLSLAGFVLAVIIHAKTVQDLIEKTVQHAT